MFPTQDEIVARIKERQSANMFGFENSEYLDWLDFEHAKPFLAEHTTAQKWAAADRPFAPTKERVIEAIVSYLPFAWDKANNCRGISAWRSLAHMQAWLWLLGGREREMADRLKNYTHYGKPQLRAISEHFLFDWQAHDNGRWTSDECGPNDGVQPAAEL